MSDDLEQFKKDELKRMRRPLTLEQAKQYVDEILGPKEQKIASLQRELELTKTRLAEAEAKCERMKAIINTLLDDTSWPTSARQEVLRLVSEPPSISLDLYHKQRNKQELGEVVKIVRRIIIECPINDEPLATHKIEQGKQALALLKRLTE